MCEPRIFPNVQIGEGAEIGEYVLIGVPPRGKAAGELATVIGDNAKIRSHTVIYAGNIIGDNFQTGHGAMVRESNRIQNNVSIGSHSIVEHHSTLGDGVRIHSQAFVPEYTVIEEGGWIGPNAVLTNARYPRSRDVGKRLRGPVIKRNAKVGANSTILPGITVGDDALVGAGSVVVKDVSPGTIVAGNPAKTINRIDNLEVYKATIELDE